MSHKNDMQIVDNVRKYWWIGAIAAVLLAALLFTCCKEGDIPFTMSQWDKEVRSNFNGLGIDQQYFGLRDYKYTTPKGAIVESVVPVPQPALEALDRGFQRQIDRFDQMFAAFPRWPHEVRGTKVFFIHPNRLTAPPGDTTVYPPCSLESIPGAPCLYANGIKTAGTVLGTDDLWNELSRDPVIILPHQADSNWQFLEYLAAAAHNEREHYDGWKYRTKEPTGFFYHFLGANDAHPQQWDTQNPVPYLKADPFLQLVSSIPHGCIGDAK